MTVDLRPDHLEIVKRILVELVPEYQVRAFGSRVRWTAKDTSDLDLVVMTEAPLDLALLADLREAFSESDLPFRVDVLDWAAVGVEFREVIEQDEAVIQQPGSTSSSGPTWRRVRKAHEGWQEIELGKVIDVKHGFAFKGEFFRDEPPSDILLTPGNFAVGGGFKKDKLKYYQGPVPEEFVLTEGDLLITMTDLSRNADTLGYPAIVPTLEGGRFLHNQRLGKVVILDDERIDKRFLFGLLCSREYRHEIVAGATGTTVKHTSPTRIKAFCTKVPPLPVQQAIACILGALDDKIELNRRTNDTLEGMARAIFRSWFVDFDPVRAKAAGRQPTSPAPHITELFPDAFEASELGEMPKGWEVTGLDAVATLRRESVKPMQAPTKLWAHYSIPAFDAGRVPIVETGANIKSGKYRVPIASVLVSKLNPRFPRAWLPDVRDEEAAICSTEFMPFVPLHYAWRPFLYELIKSDVVQKGIQERVTGSTGSRQRARPADVAVMPIVVPTPELIETFSRTVGPLHEKALDCICESRTLAELRDTLLPRLISGELRVPDAERIVKRCV